MAQDQKGRLERYRDAIRAACPDLRIDTIETGSQGQNNDVLTVNASLIFRFPRYRQGIEALRSEVCLLSAVGRDRSWPVPRPVYVSLQSGTVGDVFMGYEALPGTPLERELYRGLPTSARERLAGSLAAFLSQLHDVPREDLETCGLSPDPPLRQWQQLYERSRQHIYPLLDIPARRWLTLHFERFLMEPRHASLPSVLVHGDFGSSNILVDPESGALTGVIDFSSAHLDDPTVDLAAASTIGDDLLGRMARTYPLAANASERIAFYRGTFALQEALFGVESGDEEALRAGLAGIADQTISALRSSDPGS